MKVFYPAIGLTLALTALTTLACGQDTVPDPFPLARASLAQLEREHPIPSQTPMSLSEIESEALRNNAEIRLALRQVVVVGARARFAGSLEDPQFMYRGWGTPLAKPWDLNQTQHMFMFSQNLPGSGKRSLEAKLAGGAVEVAKAEAEAKRRDVLARVRTAFYALLRSNNELRFHDEQVALAQQSAESARIKYVVGKVPQQDILKAQTALTRLVEHLLMLRQEGDLARSQLNTLLGRDPAASVEVAGEYEPPTSLPGILHLEKLALDSRPELAATSAAIRQDETRVQLAEKSLRPDYTLSGGYMLMPTDSRYRNTYMAELSMSLPWLNRRRHDAEIAEAKAILDVDNAEYNARRTAVFAEIQESLVLARSAKRLSDLYRETLRPQAQAVLRSTVAAYQADRTDFLNLLDSQNTALDVELGYIKAVSELETRLAELERAVGAPLDRAEQRQSSGDPANTTIAVEEIRQ